MKSIAKIVGMIMYIGAGLLMFIFYILAMSKWLGFFGIILAVFICPGIVIFPIVFWIVEKVFPLFYFIVWGIGIIGMIIAGISSEN